MDWLKFSVVICIGILSGCRSTNDHLLFFTNSSIGVDISVEQGQTPVKFIVGYKRQEGVIDPLGRVKNNGAGTQKGSASEGGMGNQAQKSDDFGPETVAHSVIAKMNFGATGGGAGSSAAQWFATGKAAEFLAQNPTTPAAISGDASIGPNKELNIKQVVRYLTVLDGVYKMFDDYVSSDGVNDKEAVRVKNALDNIDKDEFKVDFPVYNIHQTIMTNSNYSVLQPVKFKTTSFGNVCDYLRILKASLDNSAKACSDKKITQTGGKEFTNDEYQALLTFVASGNVRLTKLTEEITKNEDLAKMVNIALSKK